MSAPRPFIGQSLLLFLILSVPAGALAPEESKDQGAAWHDAVTYRCLA